MANDMSLPVAVRRAALSVVGATGKGDPRAFSLVFDRFKKALGENNFLPLEQGIRSIANLGDPRGQEAFDLLKARYKGRADRLAEISYFEEQFKANRK